MFKKLLFAVLALIATMNLAFAQADVNKADAAQLESIKGVGPAMSKNILAERSKSPFKDWADFQQRVKGIGEKKAAALSEAGLSVNGQKKEGGAAKAPAAGKAKKEGAQKEDKAGMPSSSLNTEPKKEPKK